MGDFNAVDTSNVALDLFDNGGRRSSIDRRCFSYSYHIPERRSSRDRRVSMDRRSGEDRRACEGQVIDLEARRKSSDRREAWNKRSL